MGQALRAMAVALLPPDDPSRLYLEWLVGITTAAQLRDELRRLRVPEPVAGAGYESRLADAVKPALVAEYERRSTDGHDS